MTGEGRIDVAQVRVADGGGPALERGEECLPGFVEPPLGRVEDGEVVPRLRHVGMVSPKSFEDLDRFPDTPFVRPQNPVEQSAQRVAGIALEDGIEGRARLPVPLLGREGDRPIEGFAGGRGRGRGRERGQHRSQPQPEQHLSLRSHAALPPHRPDGTATAVVDGT